MTALIRLKIAVLAPIPSASESVTATVKIGLFHNSRIAWRKSLTRVSSSSIGPRLGDVAGRRDRRFRGSFGWGRRIPKRLEENLNRGSYSVDRQVFGVAM